MTTFEGWNPRYYGDAMILPGDALAHFRTRGSKNGVRKYQLPNGTWTPLGLRLRKAREGWGETKAERKLARAKAKTARVKAREATQTKILKEKEKVRAEKEKARSERQKARLARKEERRKNNLSKMTDAELQKKIERVKMEQEYKELTKNPVLKTGEKLFTALVDARAKRFEREAARAKMNLEAARVEADIVKAKQSTKRAKAEAKKAMHEQNKMHEDRKAGLKKERKATLLKAKTDWRAGTLLGGIKRRINDQLTAGVKETYKNRRTKLGEASVARILKNRSEKEARAAKAKEEKARQREHRDWERGGRLGEEPYSPPWKLTRRQGRKARKLADHYNRGGW